MRNFRKLYYFFVATVILTIIGSQLIIQYDLEKQNQDAERINIAGRQRTLSQRISKLVLYIESDVKRDSPVSRVHMDTLRVLSEEWYSVHNFLLESNKAFSLTGRTPQHIDSLLAVNTPRLEAMYKACQAVLNNPEQSVVEEARRIIVEHELPYLLTMEQTVFSYQKDAERKLSNMKQVELMLAGLAIVILVSEFALIVLPVFNRLKANNIHLESLSNELLANNIKLGQREEEISSNLEQIRLLQIDLKASERHFREMVEFANDMMYELDEQGRFTYVNPIMERTCEYSREELLHRGYWELLHPAHAEEVINFYKHQRQSQQESSYYELIIVTKSGQEIWVGQSVRMLFENGWVTKVRVIARDITQLNEAKEALKQSEAKFRALAENAPGGIFQTDAAGMVSYVNKGWLEIAGVEKEKFTGEGWISSIHSDDKERVLDKWWAAVGDGISYEDEYRFLRDGQIRWVHVIAVRLPDVAGNRGGYIGTISDITDLKVAKEKAEEAAQVKSQFLSIMSHEIRTPLNAITGLTNLLLQGEPRPDQVESLRLLKFSGENLLTIINDILDFNKIEAGKMVLEQISFDLHKLLTNIVKTLEHRATDKQIGLHLQISETTPKVITGDPVRIGQILNNLLSNAIKFTEHGSVTLSVDSEQGSAPARYSLRVVVKDTGIGIAPENIKRIFEDFSQESSDTARKYGGTGLGLSITKKLLNLMDSDLTVTSKPGIGSEFGFTLHVQEGTALEEETGQSDEIQDLSKAQVKVLLVEDNRVNQLVALNFLKRWGVVTDVVDTGEEALKRVKSKEYLLVLMDIQLPGIDGYETTRRIRQMNDAYFRKLPIIALTASLVSDVRDEGIAAGVNDFLTKPFQPGELYEAICSYTEKLHHPESGYEASGLKSFSLYAEGDAEFRKELASKLVKNIVELKEAFIASMKNSDPAVFNSACHKMKVTLSILGDNRFNELIEKLNAGINNGMRDKPEFDSTMKEFLVLSDRIVDGLGEEIERL